jgi:alanyl-tRNA synthetase
MTERLYYVDSYLTRFEARIITGGTEAVLDRTAFYPASGGQPCDHGRLGDAWVVDVVDDEAGRIVHLLDRPVEQGAVAACEIDWRRRFDHMQQHTGQHLLSAVFHDLFGWSTLSFHLGSETSTIDLSAAAVSDDQLMQAEREANERITSNLQVSVAFEDASGVQGLRKASDRSGLLRVVTIDGLDRSACGGTHVRATGEIGCLFIRKIEKIRGTVRVEFLCGGRAVARARADFNALAAAARHFSAALEETPGLVAGLVESAKEAEKSRRKLALELATLRGKEMYAATAPGAAGLRIRVEMVAALNDEIRALAQSYTAQPGARLIAACTEPPSVLYAVSEGDAPAGGRLKPLLAELAGKGGGNARIAQASLPDAAAVERAIAFLST